MLSHRTVSITLKEIKSSTVFYMFFNHNAINKVVNNKDDNYKVTMFAY